MGDMESSTIDKKSRGISFKILGLIGGLVVADIIYANFFFDPEVFNIKDGYHLALLAICGIVGLLVGRKYIGSKMLGKAYAFLGLGFIAWFIGDIGYYYNQFVLGIDPWPTAWEAGYAANYLFAVLHLHLNTRYFKPKWTPAMKAVLIGIPVIAVASYTFVAYEAWGENEGVMFDIAYSNLYVFGISFTLAYAIIGASVFRNSVLKETWLLLAIGIFLWALADSIYYYLETVEAFTHNHPVNSIWIGAFMLVIYALYKHHKAL